MSGVISGWSGLSTHCILMVSKTQKLLVLSFKLTIHYWAPFPRAAVVRIESRWLTTASAIVGPVRLFGALTWRKAVIEGANVRTNALRVSIISKDLVHEPRERPYQMNVKARHGYICLPSGPSWARTERGRCGRENTEDNEKFADFGYHVWMRSAGGDVYYVESASEACEFVPPYY